MKTGQPPPTPKLNNVTFFFKASLKSHIFISSLTSLLHPLLSFITAVKKASSHACVVSVKGFCTIVSTNCGEQLYFSYPKSFLFYLHNIQSCFSSPHLISPSMDGLSSQLVSKYYHNSLLGPYLAPSHRSVPRNMNETTELRGSTDPYDITEW